MTTKHAFLTVAERTAIQARCSAPTLTKGPWINHDPSPGDDRTIRVTDWNGLTLAGQAFATKADFDLMAHGREDVPRLLADLEAMEARAVHAENIAQAERTRSDARHRLDVEIANVNRDTLLGHMRVMTNVDAARERLRIAEASLDALRRAGTETSPADVIRAMIRQYNDAATDAAAVGAEDRVKAMEEAVHWLRDTLWIHVQSAQDGHQDPVALLRLLGPIGRICAEDLEARLAAPGWRDVPVMPKDKTR